MSAASSSGAGGVAGPAVRPLAPGEEGAVVALWERCGLTRPWNDPHADLQRALDGPSSAVLVSCDSDTGAGGAIVGSVMVGVDGHRAWVYYLGVDPSQRSTGLGRALMAAAEAWAIERGAPKMLLMVRSTNTAVRGFYDALGYAEQDTAVLGRRLDGVPDGGAKR